MADAVIVSTARTAIGTSFKGSLLDIDAYQLGTLAVAEAVRRSGIDSQLVDDVILGEILYGGGDIARCGAQPALRIRAERCPERCGIDPIGHGQGGRGRRGALELDLSAH